jgi:hypothetical protein
LHQKRFECIVQYFPQQWFGILNILTGQPGNDGQIARQDSQKITESLAELETGQLGQNRRDRMVGPDRTDGTGQLGGIAVAGQPRQDRADKTENDRKDSTAKEQDSWGGTAGTGQLVQNSRDRIDIV